MQTEKTLLSKSANCSQSLSAELPTHKHTNNTAIS